MLSNYCVALFDLARNFAYIYKSCAGIIIIVILYAAADPYDTRRIEVNTHAPDLSAALHTEKPLKVRDNHALINVFTVFMGQEGFTNQPKDVRLVLPPAVNAIQEADRNHEARKAGNRQLVFPSFREGG